MSGALSAPERPEFGLDAAAAAPATLLRSAIPVFAVAGTTGRCKLAPAEVGASALSGALPVDGGIAGWPEPRLTPEEFWPSGVFGDGDVPFTGVGAAAAPTKPAVEFGWMVGAIAEFVPVWPATFAPELGVVRPVVAEFVVGAFAVGAGGAATEFAAPVFAAALSVGCRTAPCEFTLALGSTGAGAGVLVGVAGEGAIVLAAAGAGAADGTVWPFVPTACGVGLFC